MFSIETFTVSLIVNCPRDSLAFLEEQREKGNMCV